MSSNGSRPDLSTEILHLPGPRRVDRLRRALRGGELEPAAVIQRIENWVALYHRDAQPALRVLVLEVLEAHIDPRIDTLLHEALEDRGDSVRLEALRQLLHRSPATARALALARLGDEAMEVRVFAAQWVYDTDRERALEAMVDAIHTEARGPREMHTLRWVLEFLAEEVTDRAAVERIAELREGCDDEEEMIDWALERVRRGGEDPR